MNEIKAVTNRDTIITIDMSKIIAFTVTTKEGQLYLSILDNSVNDAVYQIKNIGVPEEIMKKKIDNGYIYLNKESIILTEEEGNVVWLLLKAGNKVKTYLE